MRTVSAHLLEDKMDEAVTHYINSHQTSETVHVDASTLSLHVDTGRVVTVMQGQAFSQLSRQVSVSEQVGDGPWSEELLDSDERLDALVAHLAQHSRASHHQTSHHKMSSVRGDVDTSVILDAPLRLFNGQTLDAQSEPIVVQVPQLPALPPLQEMKRCPDTDWFNKAKNELKGESSILASTERRVLELGGAEGSPGAGGAGAAHRQHSKKSLPHKKRISRKLKRNTGNTTPQQDIVVINCGSEPPHEEILPDNFAPGAPHTLPPDAHHITHEVRPILICQLCGEFYADDQLKFYQHLKQHYEPHGTIIIENPAPGHVADLNIDKMTNTCIVDNEATLDTIAELTLGNAVSKSIYQPIDKHILYTTSDKTMYSNKVQYSMASMDKDPPAPADGDKPSLYDTLDKLEYGCGKCHKSFRKQKQCEAHIKEAHSNSKLEDMGEFSEPEDLMEGIHVTVEESGETYDQSLLPHLTVENGHVHQEHVRHWYLRTGSADALGACGADGAYCPVCPAPPPHPPAPHPPHPPHPRDPPHEPQHLKEEVLQRIFEVEVPNSEPPFPENMMSEGAELPAEPEPEPHEDDAKPAEEPDGKKKVRKFECPQCLRVFHHRNSLLYHILSHSGKQQVCRECGKGFYTVNALKIHKRVHNGDKPYKCEDCGRDFRQWSDLRYHRVSLHSDQKHFKCEFCGKEFARKYSLNVHRRIHTGEKNYKCEYCNKTFRASSYRLSHMRTHTGDRPYKCSQCEKCFRVAGDMRRHLLTHEKVRNRFEEQIKKPKEEKPKKTTHKNEIKTETKKEPEETSAKHKKIALASTARPPLAKSADSKKQLQKTPKKNQIKKVGAPNVTVSQNKNEGQFKMNTEYTNNVEVFDTRQEEYNKFKELYSDSNPEYSKDEINTYKVKDYDEQIIYKDTEQRLTDDRDFAILRPTFRNNFGDNEKQVFDYRAENTDGKMHVFTHVEKKDYNGPILTHSVALGDIRNIERDRGDVIHGEAIENGFLDKLTAFYNIPAV